MGEHWQIILTSFLIPVCITGLFFALKRTFARRDLVETEKDKLIIKLQEQCKEQEEETNYAAHDRIFSTLGKVELDIKSIDATLKLINGTVKSTASALDLHIVKGHG